LEAEDAYIPQKCEQCKKLSMCVSLGIMLCNKTFSMHEFWEIRNTTCEEEGWFKWEDRLTKYDFEVYP